jgi:hypothetical protein
VFSLDQPGGCVLESVGLVSGGVSSAAAVVLLQASWTGAASPRFW